MIFELWGKNGKKPKYKENKLLKYKMKMWKEKSIRYEIDQVEDRIRKCAKRNKQIKECDKIDSHDERG